MQDLLTNLNSYPFLDNKHKPIFTSDLAAIVPRVRRERVIDITNSPLVPATSLRKKLEILHRAGELDGGLPILRNDVLVGLIPAPDLEYALDNLPDEENNLCLMANVPSIDEDDGEIDPTDFTPYIDPVSCVDALWCRGPAETNGRRRPLRWIYSRLWTWCTSASLNWGYGISVFLRTGSLLAW